MEEKPVVASMSKEIILSIEDLQKEGSEKLPTFKRGKSSLLAPIPFPLKFQSFSTFKTPYGAETSIFSPLIDCLK
jgi:hypothetical protein